MARKDADKPMLPAVPVPHWTKCAANEECRFPGRLWVRTLARDQRICVMHYYRAIEADPSLARDEPVPPKVSA